MQLKNLVLAILWAKLQEPLEWVEVVKVVVVMEVVREEGMEELDMEVG